MKKPSKIDPSWFVYLLRCKDHSLYCGITTDIKRRVSEHNSGKGAKYIVPARRPAKCVWKQKAGEKSDALKLEYWIKRRGTEAKESIVKKKTKVALRP